MQRYVQTWSGDNATSWETLRYNLKMGLGLALSGVSNSGHDIGGFSGPSPDAELFVRWVQAGVFMPRFSIHSWNDDGTTNEPWMHPQVTATVRDLIKLRYRLQPYLYDLAWRHHAQFEPIVRPTFHDFPSDPVCWLENDDLMLGPDLLTAPVVEAGATSRSLYLPSGAAWVDYWAGERFEGGQTVTRPAPWDQPVLLVREGATIPLNIAQQHFGQRADERGFAIFPPERGRAAGSCFEDDGETNGYRKGGHGFWRVEVEDSGDRLAVTVARDGPTPPLGDRLTVLLPAREARVVDAINGRVLSERIDAQWRIVVLACRD
jgi:alpha-glucosidase